MTSPLERIKQWWRDKYNLPTNHELFQTSTWTELQMEMFQDLARRREELRQHLEDQAYDSSKTIEAINSINEVFGDPREVWDPLVDKWERELAEGKIPDLDETLADLEG